MTDPLSPESVVPVRMLDAQALPGLFAARGLEIVRVADDADIPGSYWGAPEAGLIENRLYLRADTPVHSALHEGSHFLCMDADRRARLHTDAGGTDVEEHAVCYLQCCLADQLAGYSRARCFADMDAWGYTFILGSAHAWFERDSEDAQAWLRERGMRLA
ncbi:hypothetical protein DFR24_4748 [Panacagrimonas perspica]|uniref:IrrE N-terminal-like domain-containing protein n=1 Tax=Panacagrimonas perspica TaxID=381431 RepID=A0A4R7NQJ7_9GAMM|nr:hypothetical protein [Panacagrimonas perspica]TDU23225.1 hypothetical protein DFR24_4748 [Panacagrimonas perspica]THD01372.1 hypothetical protein B1810_19690 [Panacagrimonas perspica]